MSMNRRFFMKFASLAAAAPRSTVETIKAPFIAQAGKLMTALDAAHGPSGGPVENFALDQLIEQSGMVGTKWVLEELESDYYKTYSNTANTYTYHIDSFKSVSPMVKAVYKKQEELQRKRNMQIDKLAYYMFRSARDRVSAKKKERK